MRKSLKLLAYLLSIFSISPIFGVNPKVLSVEKIWDQALHSAFTDLIFYKGAFYIAFRESNSHVGDQDGVIRILKSDDSFSWTSVAALSKAGIDLRDPKFSIMPNGTLMLSLGGSVYQNGVFISRDPQVAFSTDGQNWSQVQALNLPEEWIWGVTWFQGIGYGASYRFSDPNDIEKPWILTLFKTTDGLHYEKVTQLDVPTTFPSEAVLRFKEDGTAIALVRGGKGWTGQSQPPYTNWKWHTAHSRLGGPNFLILPNGDMWAGSRLIKGLRLGKEPKTFTAVGPMSLHRYSPVIILPSGGDTGYPGLVYLNGILYVSYYSSHEGNANIYLARIQLEKLD